MSRRVNQAVSETTPRIAFVTGGLKLGGATSFLCNIGGALVSRQIPTTVLSFESANPLGSDFTRLGIPVVTTDEQVLIYEDRLSRLYQQLKQFQPTAVVANLGPMAFEVLRYLPPGVFRVGISHSDEAGVYQTLRHYAPDMDLLAAVSLTIKNKLLGMPEFTTARVEYLPLGVPMPQDHELAQRDFSGPLRILYLGRLEQEQKRVRLFPEMLRRLQNAGLPFHWTIAGDGPEREWLQANMKNLGAEQTVSFPGQVAYQEVPPMLAQHDIFLLASDYEGLPLTLLEAMGHGLVPVVSDLPSGIRDLVDMHTGIRVSPDDIPGYINGVLRLHHDRKNMAMLSQQARNRVKAQFSVSAMADRWLGAIPENPPGSTVWPDRIRLKPILCAPNPWLFSPPVRWLRRLLSKRRHRR